MRRCATASTFCGPDDGLAAPVLVRPDGYVAAVGSAAEEEFRAQRAIVRTSAAAR